MRIRMTFEARGADSEDIRGLCEQIGMCFEELGDARLISVSQVKGSAPVKVGRGPYKNVMLSDVGIGELEARFGKAETAARIADLSYKLYQKNYKFTDHFAVILEWAEKERKGTPPAGSSQGGGLSVDGRGEGKAASFDVDEFFAAAVKKGVGE